MNLRRIDVLLFIGIKAKLHKNICKRNIFLRKGFFIRPGSKENVFFFQNIQAEAFFLQKNILKIKATAFRAQKTFFLSER